MTKKYVWQPRRKLLFGVAYHQWQLMNGIEGSPTFSTIMSQSRGGWLAFGPRGIGWDDHSYSTPHFVIPHDGLRPCQGWKHDRHGNRKPRRVLHIGKHCFRWKKWY